MDELKKINEDLENTHENFQMELGDMTNISLANKVIDIAAEKYKDIILSKNTSVTDNDDQQRNEELNSHPEFEFIDIEDENRYVDFASDKLISNERMLELDGSKFPHCLSGISDSSSASESSFVVLEPEEFEHDEKLKKECSVNRKELSITDNKMIVDENLAEVQNDFNSLSIGENEIKKLREELEKCFASFLDKIQNRSLKHERLTVKENQCSSEPDKNEIIPKTCKTCVEDSKKTFMDGSNLGYPASDMRNHHHSSPINVEWGLNTFEISSNGNCAIQTCKSNLAENHPFDSNVDAECSHRSKIKLNMYKMKAAEKVPFGNTAALSGKTDVVEKGKDEECCPIKHKESGITLTKTSTENKLPFMKRAASCKKSGVNTKKENEEYIRKRCKPKLTQQLRQSQMLAATKVNANVNAAKNLSHVKSPVKMCQTDEHSYFTTYEMKRHFMATRKLRRRKEEKELLFCVIILILLILLLYFCSIVHDFEVRRPNVSRIIE